MFAVAEINGENRQASTTQLQLQLVTSTAMTQRVQAMDAGNKTADANVKDGGAQSDTAKLIRQSISKRNTTSASTDKDAKPLDDTSAAEAEARSVVEAQEASETDLKITAAFQARHALSDLLSVIRDPEDRMLPTSPSEHAA